MERLLSFAEIVALFQPLFEASDPIPLLGRAADFFGAILDFDISLVAFSFMGLADRQIVDNRIIYSRGLVDRYERQYNDYYFSKISNGNRVIGLDGRNIPIDCRHYPQDEFINDFVAPQGIAGYMGDYYRPPQGKGFVHFAINFSRFRPDIVERNADRLSTVHPLIQAIFNGLASRVSPTPEVGAIIRGPFGRLSSRENEVARLLARRMTAKEIAEALCISRRTAEAHIAHIYHKIDVNDRATFLRWLGA